MLQQWLRDRCTPLVATLVTEDADLACRKNNLTFEQLVSAFARMDGLKVPFRSSSQQLSLDTFSCRFVRGSSMRPAPAKDGNASLADIAVRVTAEASVAAAAAAGGSGKSAGGTGGVTEAEAAALLEPSAVEDQDWYKRYRATLWEGLCHQEHEMLDCPAAVLVVVSSTEASGDPIACFDELSSPRYLPAPYQSRQYDPQSPTLVYVLLHDWCEGAARGVDPDRLLSQMRGTFTTGECRLLCINGLPAESPNLSQKDIWPDAPRAGANQASGSGVRGRCLSPEDLLSTRDFVHNLATQVVVRSMERRILSLSATVNSVRKGVKNLVKSWWKKPRDSLDTHGGDGGGAGGAKYRFDRIESQIRLLADSAFVMRDFDTAAEMYRMARDDFKSDRSLLHYASASEMLAISLYLQQQQRRAAASSAVGSPGGSYAVSPSSGGLGGAIGGAIVGGVATAAATAATVATAAGAGGVRDLSWQAGGGSGGTAVPSPSSRQHQQQQKEEQHASGSAPNSGRGGGAGTGAGAALALNPAALLGRGRDADAAFAVALEAYQRRASEDSAAAGYGSGAAAAASAAGLPPVARLGARAALLYADVAAAASEEHVERAGSRGGLAGGGEELQAQAEEALLNASVLETPLCAAVLLEVSANRCIEAGRLRRASFRLIQAGHMYKTFAKDSGEAYRREQDGPAAASSASASSSPKFLGMHAARCFLGALTGYSGSGWLAAEEYACTVLPTELRALQRPVAALQLYIRLVAAAGGKGGGRRTFAEGGGGGGGALAGSSTHSQQQQQQQHRQKQQKRAAREASLMLTLEDLCWRYPDAARVAARAWERGRESSKLDMSFFPITERARGPPPPSQQSSVTPTPGAPAVAAPSSPSQTNADLLGIDFDDDGDGQAATDAVAGNDGGQGPGGSGGSDGGAPVTAATAAAKGVGGGVVFDGLALPGVVHEETRTVDTENASVEASIQASDSSATWAPEMADALKAELAAADAVKAGKGPWLTLSASYGHKAGTLSSSRDGASASARKPSHLPPPPRPAPVGEPVTIVVVLENLLTVPVSVEDMQLVLTTPGGAGGEEEEEEEEEAACLALDEDEFHKMYSPPPPAPTKPDPLANLFASPPTPAPTDASGAAATAVAAPAAGMVMPTISSHGDGADNSAGAVRDDTALVAIERRRATVPPGERLPVLLKFCALRPAAATLTVSAVRWTVFRWDGGDAVGAGGVGEAGESGGCPRVWVSHRLEGRGRLLHATLEQRAARARAPAPPPRFEATGSMPWLGCSLEGVPPTLLQGEVIAATLNVTNRGRAPAGHLCLKTNLPWVAFEDPDRQTDATATGDGGTLPASGRATGGAVGASGTTLVPPVGVIMPGESLALPVWVRGRGGGRQTVRMVVRYKRTLPPSPRGGTEAGGAGEDAAASEGPLFNAIEALKKEEEDEERRWRTQRRAHPTSPGALCAPDVSLVHLMVLWGLDGSGQAPPRIGQHHVRSLVIRPERVDRQCPLVLTVKYPSEVSWRNTHGKDGDMGEGQGQEWRGRDGGEGQGVGDGEGCDAEVVVCATNRLSGPGDNAKVNFTFEVRSDDGPRRLSTVPGAPPLAAGGGGGGGGGSQGSSSAKRPPRNRFVWLGPTRRRVVGLGPGEATTIPLKVRFLRPGVFDLNRFRFVVEFAPPATAAGAAAAPAGEKGKSLPPAPLPTPHQQQQQRRDSSASQQGRVTFVFPAQYLVTVAPPALPPP
eukprot:g15006.t1